MQRDTWRNFSLRARANSSENKNISDSQYIFSCCTMMVDEIYHPGGCQRFAKSALESWRHCHCKPREITCDTYFKSCKSHLSISTFLKKRHMTLQYKDFQNGWSHSRCNWVCEHFLLTSWQTLDKLKILFWGCCEVCLLVNEASLHFTCRHPHGLHVT